MVWPRIQYLGTINTSSRSEQLHFFKINDKTKLWETNETFMDMQITELKNGVSIHYQGEQKKFVLKN